MQNLKNTAYRWLRSSESLFKTDMVYLAKGGFWTTSSFIFGTIGSLATMVAFGNLLPKEAYGSYTYLISLGSSLGFLTLSGAGTGVLRSVARGYENLVPVALRMQLKFNLISTGIILLAAIYYGYQGNKIFSISLGILAVSLPTSEAFHIYNHVLTAKKRFDVMAKFTLLTTIVGSVITITALFLTDSIAVLVTIFAAMSIIPSVIFYLSSTKDLDRSTPLPEQISEIKKTSIHLTGAGIIGVIASYIDKIVLFQIAGPAALAAYGFAIAGPERLKSLVKNWANIASPNLAQRSLSDISSLIYRRITILVITGSILSLSYFITSPYLFKFLLPQYIDAVKYSQILSLSLIAAPASIYIGVIFASQNMLRATYIMSVGSQFARVSLFVICTWLWGIWGLISAYLASSAFNMIYGIIIWKIELRRIINKK